MKPLSRSLLAEIILEDGCLNFVPSEANHRVAHKLCKSRGLSAFYEVQNPNQCYAVVSTTLFQGLMPSGLIIIERERRWGRAWLVSALVFLAVGICAIWRMMGS